MKIEDVRFLIDGRRNYLFHKNKLDCLYLGVIVSKMFSVENSEQRIVKINFCEESKHVIVKNNTLRKSMLKEYFPQGGSLTYKMNGDTFMLDTDNENVYVNPNVDVYDLSMRTDDSIPKLGAKRVARFNEILEKLHTAKHPIEKPGKKKLTEVKIANKKQEIGMKEENSSQKKSFLKRVVHIAWKHRRNFDSKYEFMGITIGPKKTIILNGNQDYSLQELQSLLLEEYVNDSNKYYFEESVICLGKYDETRIVSYKNSDGQKCGFWEYSKGLRNKGHILTIFLLTTKMHLEIEHLTPPKQSSSYLKETESLMFRTSSAKNFGSTENVSSRPARTNVDKVGDMESSFTMPESLTIRRSSLKDLGNMGNLSSKPVNRSFDKIRDIEYKDFGNMQNVSSVSNLSLPSPTFSKLSGLMSNPLKPSGTSGYQSLITNELENNSKVPSKHLVDDLDKNVSHYKKIKYENTKCGYMKNFEFLKLHVNKVITNFPTKNPLKGAGIGESAHFISSESAKNLQIPSHHDADSNKENKSKFEKSEEPKQKSGTMNHFQIPQMPHNRAPTNKIKLLNLGIPIIKESDITFSDVQLGRGGQGIVTKGKYLGSNVAIKTMLKGNNEKLVLREIQILDKIRHPNITAIMAVSCSITHFHIVMEYFNSHSLHDILFKPKIKVQYLLNTANKNTIAYQISCALTFLHLQPSPITHRDIKPGNILVDKQFVTKLCDLGLGKCNNVDLSLQTTSVGTVRGTYLFMAPEIILHRKEATQFSDVWAFGCTLIELYNEQRVWDVDGFTHIYYSLMEILQKKKVPHMGKVPTFINSKLRQCFNYYDTGRPHVSELLHLFEEACN